MYFVIDATYENVLLWSITCEEIPQSNTCLINVFVNHVWDMSTYKIAITFGMCYYFDKKSQGCFISVQFLIHNQFSPSVYHDIYSRVKY